jgi:putative DNA primase/helicase
MPHQHTTQVGNLTYSKRQLDNEANMAAVHAIVCREARMSSGQVLVVAQMEAEAALLASNLLPNNVVTAHHNAVAGRDEWRDVAKLIVIGRTAAPPAALERQAEAMTGEAIAPLVGWYPVAATARELTNGKWCTAQADRHPHSIAEAMRWHVTEGELIQIIGRARGADRQATNPVDVLAMVNTVIPIPVERVIAADTLAPSVVDKMLAAGGAALMNPADAADCYPNLWPTHEGARTAWKRGTLVHLLIDKYLSRDEPKIALLTPATYQRTGRGQRSTVAWFDPALVPDPREWLEARLGLLAAFHLGGVQPAGENTPAQEKVDEPTETMLPEAEKVETPVVTGTLSPELTAIRAVTTATDSEKLVRRAKLRPSPPEYHEGCVPLVPGGYGDPLDVLSGMQSLRCGIITDIFTITSNTDTLLVMISGLEIIIISKQSSRSDR